MTKVDQFTAQSESEQKNLLSNLCRNEIFGSISDNLLIFRILPFLNLECGKFQKEKLRVLLLMSSRRSIKVQEYNEKLIPVILATIKDFEDVNLVIKSGSARGFQSLVMEHQVKF